MIKHLLTITLIFLSIQVMHPTDSIDDVFLNFSLDDVTNDVTNTLPKESPKQKMTINGSVAVTQKSGFQYGKSYR